MEIASLVLAALALVLAFLAYRNARSQEGRIERVDVDGRRRVANLAEELEQETAALRNFIISLSEGKPLTREMISEGRLWEETDGPSAQRIVEAGNVRILDVRSPQETAGGVIPGAILIPIEELEERVAEIPKDGKTTLVYCAAGGRSAAACEFLGSKGHLSMVNLSGGVGAWPGTLDKPRPA